MGYLGKYLSNASLPTIPTLPHSGKNPGQIAVKMEKTVADYWEF